MAGSPGSSSPAYPSDHTSGHQPLGHCSPILQLKYAALAHTSGLLPSVFPEMFLLQVLRWLPPPSYGPQSKCHLPPGHPPELPDYRSREALCPPFSLSRNRFSSKMRILVVRETQIKTPVREHLSPIRRTTLKNHKQHKAEDNKRWRGCGEIVHCWCKGVQPL